MDVLGTYVLEYWYVGFIVAAIFYVFYLNRTQKNDAVTWLDKHALLIFGIIIIALLCFIFDTCGGCPQGCSLDEKVRKKKAERFWRKQKLREKKHILRVELEQKKAEEQHKRELASLAVQKKEWRMKLKAELLPTLTKLQEAVAKAQISQAKTYAKMRKELETQELRAKPMTQLINKWKRLSRDIKEFQEQTAKKLLQDKNIHLWNVFNTFVRNPKKLKQEQYAVKFTLHKTIRIPKTVTHHTKSEEEKGRKTLRTRFLKVEALRLETFLRMRLQAKNDAITRLQDLRNGLKASIMYCARGSHLPENKKIEARAILDILLDILKEEYYNFVHRRNACLCLEKSMNIIDHSFLHETKSVCFRFGKRKLLEQERIHFFVSTKLKSEQKKEAKKGEQEKPKKNLKTKWKKRRRKKGRKTLRLLIR